MQVKLETLERLAKAATPGRWRNTKGYMLFTESGAKCASAWENYAYDSSQTIDAAQASVNAKYIEAASPDNMLALIGELLKTQRALHYLAGKCVQHEASGPWGYMKITEEEVLEAIKRYEAEAYEAAEQNRKGFTYFEGKEL